MVSVVVGHEGDEGGLDDPCPETIASLNARLAPSELRDEMASPVSHLRPSGVRPPCEVSEPTVRHASPRC